MNLKQFYKSLFMMLVLGILLVVPKYEANAAIINKTEKHTLTMQVGDTESYIGRNLKINNKKYSKYKKKIKVSLLEYDTQKYSYNVASYFESYELNPGKVTTSSLCGEGKRYLSGGEYSCVFLKPGTYNISYDTYETQFIHPRYEKTAKDAKGVTKRLYRMYDSNGDLINSEYYTYETKTDKGYSVGEYYKSTTSNKIYAEYLDYVPATIAIAADGKPHIKYGPQNVIRTTHKYSIKVMKTKEAIASVSLGKSKVSSKRTSNGYKTTTESVSKRFLSGNNGKLVVKTTGKNFVINSIIIETYDKDGNVVYKQVKNKDIINYGLFRTGHPTQTSYYGTSRESSLYNNTIVHIGYTDKFNNTYSKYTIVTTKDSYGKSIQTIKSEYKRIDEPKQEHVGGLFYGPCHETYTFYKK